MDWEPQADRPQTETKVSLPEHLLKRAGELGVDVSRAVAQGLEAAVEAAEETARRKRAAEEWRAFDGKDGILFEDLQERIV